jgi:heme A synthase
VAHETLFSPVERLYKSLGFSSPTGLRDGAAVLFVLALLLLLSSWMSSTSSPSKRSKAARRSALLAGLILLAVSAYVGTACAASDFGLLSPDKHAQHAAWLRTGVAPLARFDQFSRNYGCSLRAEEWHAIAALLAVVALTLLLVSRKSRTRVASDAAQ